LMPIQFDFSGKGVFVTDSAAGLGRCIAGAFHELGATVAIHDLSPREVDKTIRELGGSRLVAAPGDLTTTASVQGIVEKALGDLGRLDVLVCCAMEWSLCAVDQISEQGFERAMGANTKKAFFTTQACVPALRTAQGAVVHVAPVIGLVGGPIGAVAYATAGGSTVQMTRMMALELAAEGIRVNAVCPGWAAADAPPDYAAYIQKRSPLGRIATPEECAAAVLYLAAPFSGYTMGEVLMVDGGITSGHYVT
jgi:NAD(P)-dependent dehydrogenase (short-subunit alcohol dehydrogenase family)